MKNKLLFVLLFCLSCGCSHLDRSASDDTIAVEDSIVLDCPQMHTYSFRVNVIKALYMLGCNNRLKMGLPDDYKEDTWRFYYIIDSLVKTPDYYARIEANLAKGNHYRHDLQDSVAHWLFLSRMLDFPLYGDLAYPENGIIDEMPQTRHLLEKYIDRDIQCIESLSMLQWDYYQYDIINYLFSIPYKEQMDFIIDYYIKVKNIPKAERPQ